jgi:hypothetical protein
MNQDSVGDGGAEHPKAKRLRIQEEVTVVVGGKEFVEDIHQLCHLSEYFAAAVRSGMKEAATKRFEFPERDPEEWDLISELFQPFPMRQITAENVHTVLNWFDFLVVPRGFVNCDRALAYCVPEEDAMTARFHYSWDHRKEVDQVVSILTKIVPYRSHMPVTEKKLHPIHASRVRVSL